MVDSMAELEVEVESFSDEEIAELKGLVNEYQERIEEFNNDIDELLEEINDTKIYNELEMELNVSIEFVYSVDQNED
jgi:peptidoglycan hydrolase CwlO-like protein